MDELLSALRAAGEPTRLRLLALLSRSELTVTELTHILGQSQPRVSRHLKLLAESGLVERFREGNWVFYRVADQGQDGAACGDLAESLVGFIPASDPLIERDIERLDRVRRDRAEAAAAYFRANADAWGRIEALHLPEEAIEQALLEMIGTEPIEHLVDFGSGTGRILELLGKGAARGLGVDLSPDMLALARAALERAELRHCQVRQGDILALNQPSASADLVTIHQVLHFLDDPARAVAEAARILRAGGRLAVVDFEAHDLEFLREAHAHRRLGFADKDVQGWFRACDMELEAVRKLPEGDDTKSQDPETADPDLTVCIWLARKRAVPLSPPTSSVPQPREVLS